MRDHSAARECAVDESADHGGEGFGVLDGEVVVVAEHQRYSYRAYPTAAQTLMLAKTFGCARVVFNDSSPTAGTRMRRGASSLISMR